MWKRDERWRRALPAMAAVTALMMSSCASYELSRVDTFVGPDGSAAPSTTVATTPATGPSADVPIVPPTGPIRLNVQQALVVALNNNKALIVDKYNPPIRRTFEDEELAAFDPVLFGNLSAGRTRQPFQGTVFNAQVNADAGAGLVGLTEFLPSGTRLDATASGTFTHDPTNREQDIQRVGLTATQSLLRGFGLDVNLASLHQAQIDTRAGEYELRGLALSIVAQTEEAYWDYVLALRQIEIVTQSLALAQKQLDEINTQIRVERMAQSERAAAEAEVALRRQDLINANSAAATSRLALLRLISPPGADGLSRQVLIEQQPIVKDIPLDPVEQHVALAAEMRPEMNQARLLVNRNELDIVKTRNGMLPRLDVFITLGKSGYADSFGKASGNLFSRGDYDALVGVSGEYPLGDRGPRAQFDRAVMGRDQSLKALENLAQLVEVDVRDSYIEVQRTRELIAATTATRKLQEENLRAETAKFREGRSTSLQVAQVQRDLEVSQIAEVRAVANCLKAYVELYRLDGSLLQRRGISAPGKEPARLTAKQ